MKTTIKKWGINGEGIAYLNKKPVFIEGAIPNETVRFSITKENRNYSIGQLEEVIEPVSSRRYTLCPIAKNCGGCAMMHVQYKAQCKMKEQILKEALKKYAHYSKKIEPIIKNENPLGYRNSCKLPFGLKNNRLVCGMYAKNSQNFVEMDRCFIHSKHIERVRHEVLDILNEFNAKPYNKTFQTGYRTLVIKEFNEQLQVILVTGKDKISDELIERLANIEGVDSLWQSIKLDDNIDVFGKHMIHLSKEKNISIHLNDFNLSLLPRSFFQLNTKQAIKMYQLISDWMPKSKCIVEAYSGIGAISLFLKDKAEKIIGIEYIQDAVDNANENATINQAKNVHFICGDAGQELVKLSKTQRIDSLVVDPPRTGLDNTMKKTILSSNIKNIIYVSCNPSTLAKDLNQLQEKYTIHKIQPFDLFSQTQHVETVVLMSKVQK